MSETTPLRIAVVGDLHISNKDRLATKNVAETVIHKMAERSDALVFVGDMVHTGRRAEAELFSRIVREVEKPVFAVLGNHELLGNQQEIVTIFEDNGITVLQAEKTRLSHEERKAAIIGIKGGYDGSFAESIPIARKKFSELGRRRLAPELKRLNELLEEETENIILLSHYPPVFETIVGEEPQWYDLHGSKEIGRIADQKSEHVQVIFHGHTHKGGHSGQTEKGIPVYNVALPVLGRTLALSKEEVMTDPPVFVAEFSKEGKFLKQHLSR